MSFFHFLKNKKTASQKAKMMSDTSERTTYLLGEDTPFAVTEAFRNLKTMLSVSLPKTDASIGSSFLCSSSYPSEGKTTVAVNTALMLSYDKPNAKVVIVDTDLRAGRVSKFFGVHHVPGLSDYLSGQATLDQILHPSPVSPNLYVICRGTRTARPYELLADDGFKALNAELKKSFAYVIYDSAPFMVVSDALAVAPVADGTLLIARYNYSKESDIRAAEESLKFVKANVLGIVVNDYAPDSFSKKDYRQTQYYSYGAYAKAAKKAQEQEKKEEQQNK